MKKLKFDVVKQDNKRYYRVTNYYTGEQIYCPSIIKLIQHLPIIIKDYKEGKKHYEK